MTAVAKKRGCKVGQPHSGQFNAGHDPRRSRAGWSSLHKQQSVEDQFKIHTAEAIKTLRQIMADQDQPATARARAATEILDRAYGKAVDRVAIANVDQSSVTTNVTSLSDKQLLAIALEGVVELDSTDSESDSTDITVVSEQ